MARTAKEVAVTRIDKFTAEQFDKKMKQFEGLGIDQHIETIRAQMSAFQRVIHELPEDVKKKPRKKSSVLVEEPIEMGLTGAVEDRAGHEVNGNQVQLFSIPNQAPEVCIIPEAVEAELRYEPGAIYQTNALGYEGHVLIDGMTEDGRLICKYLENEVAKTITLEAHRLGARVE